MPNVYGPEMLFCLCLLGPRFGGLKCHKKCHGSGRGFSSHYSSFRKIKVGTPVETVRSALGEPWHQFTNANKETWLFYSFHKSGRTPFYFESCWFKERGLMVSNGLVVEKFNCINDD